MRDARLATIEFDSPFEITEDGNLNEDCPDTYAPTVLHDEHTDIYIDDEAWEAFSFGYTGQDGYRGAVMHSSEYLGGRLADDILTTPGIYVICAVEIDNGEGFEDTPAGWVVLRMKD